MIHFRSREETNAADIRKHQYRMAKLETKKLLFSRSDYPNLAILTFARVAVLTIVIGVTIYHTTALFAPVNLDAVKENNRHSEFANLKEDTRNQILLSSAGVADRIKMVKAKADSVAETNK